MTDYLDEREFLEPAVCALSPVSATHAPKAVLAVLRLAARFPALPVDHWHEAWRVARIDALPRAQGLFAETIALPDPSVIAGPGRPAILAARGLLPLAYPAFHAWVAAEGFQEVVLSYAERAAVEPGYLGHGFSVWCSFVELAALLDRQADLVPWATERFCEFVAQAFPGHPVGDSSWRPPVPGEPPEITREELMSAALSRPGFFGHSLLSLAALVRHGERLSHEALRAVSWSLLAATTRRYPDSEDHERLPVKAQAPETLQAMVVALTLGERADVHNLTLADALCTLWNHFPTNETRVRLQAIGAHYARLPLPNTPLPTAGRQRLVLSRKPIFPSS